MQLLAKVKKFCRKLFWATLMFQHNVVPENVHTHPKEGFWKLQEWGKVA